MTEEQGEHTQRLAREAQQRAAFEARFPQTFARRQEKRMEFPHHIAEIDREIARLLEHKKALQDRAYIPWPKRLTLYAHCSKETNWEKGEQLGLTGEALSFFAYFEKIALEVEVAEDGMVTIVACDGRKLEHKREI